MIGGVLQSRAYRRFRRNHAALGGLVVYAAFIAVALLAPWIAPYSPYEQDLYYGLDGPTWEHPLGRDEFGRDVLSRVLYGARVSIKVGLAVVSVSATVGILVGCLAGWVGGWTDEILMRLTDILLAFPGLLLAIALVALLGPGLENVILALCATGWVGFARLVRGQVLQVRELDYIQAARALGCTGWRIVFVHILPAILAPVLIQATFGVAGAIIGEASLSFLGLGVQAPIPSWGSILNEGVDKVATGYGAHLTIFPGAAIMLAVLALNFLGDGLRDALDARLEARG